MDLWVVAAATGAGYIAKYWQHLSGEKDVSSDSLTGNSIQGQSEPQNLLPDQANPLHRLAQKRFGGYVSPDREEEVSNKIASTSGSHGEFLGNFDNREDYNNLFSLANLSPGFGGRGNFEGNANETSRENEFSGKLTKNRSLRSRGSSGPLVKPLSSLESCLNAQLYRDHTKMEEYVYSSVPSPCTPAVRPLLVTDGSRILSRANSDPFGSRVDSEDKLEREDGVCLVDNDTLLRTKPLQCCGLVELPSTPKQRRGGLVRSQGSVNGMLLFFIGITIGMISASVANKRELDKLNKLLNQTENLVQDLHEELEMKDILTVNELANEGTQSRRPIESSSFKKELDESAKYDSKEPNDQKVNSEAMSKIEAELEAELERLEQNMTVPSLESISNFVELDPDFEADVVRGELKLNAVRKQTGGSSDLDHDASGSSTVHTETAKYAVSPRELSLLLHEVIESRLEARIKELETELENSEKRFHSLESQTMIYSEVESISTPESPIFINENSERDQPLLINLEALDAYEEAYEEMMMIIETDRNTSDKALLDARNNGASLHRDGTEKWSRNNLVCDKIKTWEERSRESDEVGMSEDGDDEDELLIKQIVEKARRDSFLNLNVDQMYSTDGNI